MGRPALEEKLRSQLLCATELTEARVVYMLVCIRKLMEFGGPRFPSLNFHCNWPLHSKLDKKDAVAVIKLFDDLEIELETGHQESVRAARAALHQIIHVHSFRSELGTFLEAHHLPADLTTLASPWTKFLNVYIRVISDVPLEFTSTPIRNIRRVVVRHIEECPVPQQFMRNFEFAMEWTAHRFDGGVSAPHQISLSIFPQRSITDEPNIASASE